MDEPTNHLDALSVEWLQVTGTATGGAILSITYTIATLIALITGLSTEAIFIAMLALLLLYSRKALKKSLLLAVSAKHQGVLRRELWPRKRGPGKRVASNKSSY